MTDRLPEHTLEWQLFERWAMLRADLAATLDINAGLREVLIPEQHHTLIADLAAGLDIESGLAAIVPEARPRLPIRPIPERYDPTTSSMVDDLKLLPLHTRWILRSNMLSKGLEPAFTMAVSMARVCAPVKPPGEGVMTSDVKYWVTWLDTYVSVFEALLDKVAGSANMGIDLLKTHAEGAPQQVVDKLTDEWIDLIQAAAEPNDEIVRLQKKFERGALGPHELQHFVAVRLNGAIVQLVQAINETIYALNDFVGDDFRASNGLEKIHLDGLRWSLETSFPPDWQEEIDRDSVPIGDGVFEVQQGNTRTLV
ncbi:hypothetical protein [Nocardia anaemiae]|uniref:hypothetical protein n=1 Tax=Nocardia anaemiae TaxID=263910 RepID=UPI0007A4C099|nr:hypothetical protein [Nocardia anaemiae]